MSGDGQAPLLQLLFFFRDATLKNNDPKVANKGFLRHFTLFVLARNISNSIIIQVSTSTRGKLMRYLRTHQNLTPLLLQENIKSILNFSCGGKF